MNDHRTIQAGDQPDGAYGVVQWPSAAPAIQEVFTFEVLTPTQSVRSEERSSSGRFVVPDLTDSDEEEIARLEEEEARQRYHTHDLPCKFRPSSSQPTDTFSPAALGQNIFKFEANLASPGGSGTSLLGDDTSLFSIVNSSPLAGSMVVEREPPRGSPLKTQQQQPAVRNLDAAGPQTTLSSVPPPSFNPSATGQTGPSSSNAASVQFGRPSNIQHRQQARNNVFNMPKPGKPRPEHHRPVPPAPNMQGGRPSQMTSGPSLGQVRQFSAGANGFVNPYHPRPINHNPDVVEIPKPAQPRTWTSYAPPPRVYSAFPTDVQQRPPQTTQAAPTVINLATPEHTAFSDAVLNTNQRFGEPDPYLHIDADKASENIKALLEGTFEDEEDKPRTRSRKAKSKIKQGAEALTDGLKALAVGDGIKDEERGESVGQTAGQDVAEEEEDDEDDGTVEGLKVQLLPHQVEGVEWMKDKEVGRQKKNAVLPKGGILADDMGLGKTIQSIALMLINPRPPLNSGSVASEKPALPAKIGKNTLIVAPLALIRQWEDEIKTKVSDSHRLKVCVHHGPQRTRSYADLQKYDVVITTYQILVSEHGSSSDTLQAGCFGIHWYRVILDEAHSIKNRNAKASQACCALRAEYRWCLTGTPMQNNLEELQSLIKFLRIKPYNDIHVFKDQITRPMSQGRGGIAIKRLQVYLKAFMKRRTKDILKQEGALNPGGKKDSKNGATQGFRIVDRKIESVTVEFSDAERDFYERLEQRTGKSLDDLMHNEGMNYASALVLLLRLRQACNHPDLLKGKLANDNDALTTGQNAAQTPRKSRVVDQDVDDMANLLGGLSVEVKKCEVCQTRLESREVMAGNTRCQDCEQDLANQAIAGKGKKTSASDDDDDDDDSDDSDDDLPSHATDHFVSHPVVSAKISALLPILHRETASHKVIVYSQFTSMLDLIEPFLRTTTPPIRYVRYDGSMRPDAREDALARLRRPFNSATASASGTSTTSIDPTAPRVLLCSLKCGSLGLNLTAASRVVILEPFWNPFVEEQAIDRVHRLNQTVDVHVYKLTVADTVEARILDLQEKKRELARLTVEQGQQSKGKGKAGAGGMGGAAAGKLTLKDILSLFGKGAEHDSRHDQHHHHHGLIGSSGAGAQSTLDHRLAQRTGVLRREEQTGEEASERGGHGGAIAASSGNAMSKRKEDPVYGRRW